MEIIYAILILHHAKKDITKEAVRQILDSVEYKASEIELKKMVSGLKDLSEEFLNDLPSFVRSLDANRNVLQRLGEEEDDEEEEEIKGLTDLFGGKDDSTGISSLFG